MKKQLFNYFSRLRDSLLIRGVLHLQRNFYRRNLAPARPVSYIYRNYFPRTLGVRLSEIQEDLSDLNQYYAPGSSCSYYDVSKFFVKNKFKYK